MSIPKFLEYSNPMLEWLSDGKPKHNKDFSEVAIKKFNITEKEQELKLKSGQLLFESRYRWTQLYLKSAGLIKIPERGFLCITELGLKFLDSGLKINKKSDLKQFPLFLKWYNQTKRNKDHLANNLDINDLTKSSMITPEEQIEINIKELNNILTSNLLEKVNLMTPRDFEYLVVKLLTLMGYGGAEKNSGVVTGKSGDGGIDGIISEDRLGLSKIYIQAKHWQNSVGDNEIRNFIGSMSSRGATKGVFITTSDYTKQAISTIEKSKSSTEIVLINGQELVELMIEYNLGVSTISNYEIKRIDSDYFE